MGNGKGREYSLRGLSLHTLQVRSDSWDGKAAVHYGISHPVLPSLLFNERVVDPAAL